VLSKFFIRGLQSVVAPRPPETLIRHWLWHIPNSMETPICSISVLDYVCVILFCDVFFLYYLFPLFVFLGNRCVAKVSSDPIWKFVFTKLKTNETMMHGNTKWFTSTWPPPFFLNHEFIQILVFRVLSILIFLVFFRMSYNF